MTKSSCRYVRMVDADLMDVSSGNFIRPIVLGLAAIFFRAYVRPCRSFLTGPVRCASTFGSTMRLQPCRINHPRLLHLRVVEIPGDLPPLRQEIGNEVLEKLQDFDGPYPHSGVRFDAMKARLNCVRPLETFLRASCFLYVSDMEACGRQEEVESARAVSPSEGQQRFDRTAGVMDIASMHWWDSMRQVIVLAA
jgi:hypothetical protein